MKRLIGCAVLVLVLGLGALLQATAGDQDAGVRPYFGTASATMVLDVTSGYCVYVDSGIINHLGPEANFSTGMLDANGILTATGTVTTSNGDKIFYDSRGALDGETVITLTGGTGRFVNVSGEVTLAPPQDVQMIQHGTLAIMTFDITGQGWINY